MSTTVFVAGASGYIGWGVTQAFRRAGFTVYGLVRTQEKAKFLRQHEIIPVLASGLDDVESYKAVLDKCQVIVDAIGHGEHTELFLKAANEAAGKRFAKTSNDDYEEVILDNYKPLYIFTSGIMTYGLASTGPVDEWVRPVAGVPQVEKRRQCENSILAFSQKPGVFLRTAVTRPGFVYGGQGGSVADDYFGIPIDQDLVIYGSLEKRWSWVHVDDLGDAYVLLARSPTAKGQIYNLASMSDNPTHGELRTKMAKAAGWDEKKNKVEQRPVPKDDVMLGVFEASSVINPVKAYEQLGWKPRHVSFLDQIDVYYQSWLANKK